MIGSLPHIGRRAGLVDRLVSMGMVIVGQAVAVIGQDLDNSAFGDLAVGALMSQHAFQFGPQGLKARDPVFHGLKMAGGDFIGALARLLGRVGQRQQFPDRIQAEAQVSAVADEGQTLDVFIAVKPLVAGRAEGIGHQADLFVVAHSGDLGAGFAGQMTDGEFFDGHGVSRGFRLNL